jgi:hypothetical protein
MGEKQGLFSPIWPYSQTVGTDWWRAVKRARPREGTGEARLPHGRTNAEVAECLSERVVATRVSKLDATCRATPASSATSSSPELCILDPLQRGWGPARRGPRRGGDRRECPHTHVRRRTDLDFGWLQPSQFRPSRMGAGSRWQCNIFSNNEIQSVFVSAYGLRQQHP